MHEAHAANPEEYWQVTAVPHTVDHGQPARDPQREAESLMANPLWTPKPTADPLNLSPAWQQWQGSPVTRFPQGQGSAGAA